jgi:hypothetical protein
VFSRKLLGLAPGAALAAALAAVPAAQAATVASEVPCVRYVPGVKSFPVSASGFAPGAFLSFKAGQDTIGSGQADGTGAFDNAADPFSPPSIPLNRNKVTVQLTADDGNGTVAGPVPVSVTRITVALPDHAKPRQRVRFRVFGFVPGKPVYLHVRRNNRTKGRFSLGRAAGACGLVTKRMRFMPLSSYRTGTYRYAFSQSKRYDRSKVLAGGKVTIYETFHASRAQATAISG